MNTPAPYPHPEMTSRTFVVTGVTCAHCVRAVGEEVGLVPGVAGVAVDLGSGRLTVTGEDVADDAVRAAVAEAGYAVAS